MKTTPWQVLSSHPELATELAVLSQERGVTLDIQLVQNPLNDAQRALFKGQDVAIALVETPELSQIVELARTAHQQKRRVVLALLEQSRSARAIRELSSDMGMSCVEDLGSMLSVVTLLLAGAKRPWAASVRSLNAVDRARLRPVLSTPEPQAGVLTSGADFNVTWQLTDKSAAHIIGPRQHAADALAAVKASDPFELPLMDASLATPSDVDHPAIEQVLFGPARALSDPASKAVLRPYGVPCPEEELCTSPSRTASEATRMGFPVRIALASPDLRAWNHPDLVVDAVDNASRARQVFQHITELAKERAPDARLLGVTVSTTRIERALLRVRLTPLVQGLVLLQIGFADAHGMAAGDLTMSYLPTSPVRFERMLKRLSGHNLLFGPGGQSRHPGIDALLDVLQRLAAFANDRRSEVESIELNPLAVLLDGSLEAREACVTVTDAYSRLLSQAGAGSGR